MIFIINYMVIIILTFFLFSINDMCLIVRTDLITIYDIIKFYHWDSSLGTIGTSTVGLVVCTSSENFHIYYYGMWQDDSLF